MFCFLVVLFNFDLLQNTSHSPTRPTDFSLRATTWRYTQSVVYLSEKEKALPFFFFFACWLTLLWYQCNLMKLAACPPLLAPLFHYSLSMYVTSTWWDVVTFITAVWVTYWVKLKWMINCNKKTLIWCCRSRACFVCMLTSFLRGHKWFLLK